MLRDIRQAVRRFWVKPGHTLLMILIVGVGMGATTAVFSVVDQTILRPPPFAHADRLVQVMDLYESGARSTTLSLEKISGWQQQRALFEAFEGYAYREVDLTGSELEPERIRGRIVTNALLSMLGVQPLLGRGFTAADGNAGSEPVALISETLWKRKFGARREVLGTQVALSDEPHTIVGVLPRRFRIGGDDEDLWLPIDVRHRSRVPRLMFVGLARLAPGVDRQSQQTLARTLASRMQAEMPLPSDPFWNISLQPKTVASVPPTTRTALFVLLGAVGFVLLITCANTASLFLSQIGARQRELAIRSAIGASRGRLFREVLIESLLLAVSGGAFGILLATWGVDAIVAAAPPNLAYNATTPIEVDMRILSLAGVLTLITGVLFGLVPALRGSRPNVDSILKGGAGGAHGRTERGRFSSVLLVAEVAFSLILLVGAALMLRTFVNLHALNPGFDGQGVVAMNLSLPTDKYVGEGARSAFFESVREPLAGLPGVSAVAVARGVFGGSGTYYGTAHEIEGREAASGGRLQVISNTVTADYFRALRIPFIAGRTFNEADASEAVVISNSLADRLWPDGTAVGRGFRLGAGYPRQTVIGIAGDIQERAVDVATTLRVYTRFSPPTAPSGSPPRTRGYAERVLIVRADNPAAVIPAMREAVWSADRNQPIGNTSLVDDIYADAFGRERFVLQLMSAFGLIAVALTGAGLFGVLAQIVARRTREIGLRVALGARALDIVHLITTRALTLVLVGAGLGLAGALALSQFLDALLFQVRPTDVVCLAGVTLLMMAIAMAACWVPARRAMRVDPAVALRVD